MFIAIIGTRCSGKSTVEGFLVSSKGFQSIQLLNGQKDSVAYLPDEETNSGTSSSVFPTPSQAIERPASLLANNSDCPRIPRIQFSSPSQMLTHVTRNWQSNFVTVDLDTRALIEGFMKRPFFVVLSVDAPLLQRFARLNSARSLAPISLESFVRENDEVLYGPELEHTAGSKNCMASVHALEDLMRIHIVNSFESIDALHSHVDGLDLLNPALLRPSWDDYFMTLAALASRRSNCMKRRVGAILVRENRILATGYNGTPRGLTNCNEGGCAHCNGASQSLECVCLHAEENALLEAGRERVGDRAVLYCNTCPCLKCTVKIIQTGVKEVVYNLSYKVDKASAELFREAGVELRRHERRLP